MRLVVFIFTIYLTGIMSFPCTDDLDCDDCHDTQIAETHEEDNCDNEQCSPFCTCQCCHTNISWTNTSVAEDPQNFEITYSNLSILYHRQIVFSIWDPPRSV